MFVIVGLMYCGWPGAATLAFFLFIAGAVGDWLDGYLARRLSLISNFGKLMVMGIVIALVDKHEIPVVLALVTLCREFMITGMRMVAASKGVVVAADSGGKSKTVTQLIALGFLLGAPMLAHDWAGLLGGSASHVVDLVSKVGVFIFAAGTVLSVWSGYRYIARNARTVFGE